MADIYDTVSNILLNKIQNIKKKKNSDVILNITSLNQDDILQNILNNHEHILGIRIVSFRYDKEFIIKLYRLCNDKNIILINNAALTSATDIDLDFITKYSDIITIYPVGEDIIYSLEEHCQHNDCGIILIYLGIYMNEIARYKERFFYLILGILFLQTIKNNFNKLQLDNGISIIYHNHSSKL